jgi:hypothetical protein
MPRFTHTVSITQLKARTKTLTHQFTNTSMILLQTCRKCFQSQDGYKGTMYDVRNMLNRAQTNKELYMNFYQQLMKLVPYLPDLIERTVSCQVEFLKLENCLVKIDSENYVLEPIHKLWIFLLKLMFEKPILLLEKEDSKDGLLVGIIRESLPSFIADCIPTTSTCTLTQENVAQLSSTS